MPSTEILGTFDAFRQQIDDYNDRRERLIKLSRDITNASKKVIFLLHRTWAREDLDEPTASATAVREARKKLREIQALFVSVAEETSGEDFWRHQRNVSPGLQEYIEALSFAHYLEYGNLITYSQVQDSLAAQSLQELPVSDYLLGISDLTGELMRLAIVAIARKGGGPKKAREVCTFVRNYLEKFTPYVRDLHKKQDVTTASLKKIEDALYAVVVRGAEFSGDLTVADEIVSRYVAGLDFRDSGGGDERLE